MSDLMYEFKGLRGVGHVQLSFAVDQRVYALFGINGVGKTKCLEALFQYFLLGCKSFMSYKLLSMEYKAFVARWYGGPEMNVIVPEFDPRQTGLINSAMHARRQSIAEFHELPVVFLGAGQRGHVDNTSVKSEAIGTFENRRKRYFRQVIDGMCNSFSSLGMHEGLEQWFVTLAQSANPYQKDGDNRKVEIDTLLQLLHRIDNRYDPDFMEIDGANHVSLKVDGVPTELRHLSTGFTSLIKILQAIISGYANFTNEVNLTRVKGYVFIDEIESHLHSQWQSKIVVLLKELFPNTTFFLASHSPIVLSQLAEGEAYLLRRNEGGIVESHLIPRPDGRILADLLDEAMGVDLNALKVQRMDPARQTQAKATLLQLLKTDGASPDA